MMLGIDKQNLHFFRLNWVFVQEYRSQLARYIGQLVNRKYCIAVYNLTFCQGINQGNFWGHKLSSLSHILYLHNDAILVIKFQCATIKTLKCAIVSIYAVRQFSKIFINAAMNNFNNKEGTKVVISYSSVVLVLIIKNLQR